MPARLKAFGHDDDYASSVHTSAEMSTHKLEYYLHTPYADQIDVAINFTNAITCTLCAGKARGSSSSNSNSHTSARNQRVRFLHAQALSLICH